VKCTAFRQRSVRVSTQNADAVFSPLKCNTNCCLFRSIARYLGQLDTADRRAAAGEDPSDAVRLTNTRLKERLVKLEEEVKRLKAVEAQVHASPDQQISLTDPDFRSMAHFCFKFWVGAAAIGSAHGSATDRRGVVRLCASTRQAMNSSR
jgi:hypothetical protein